MKQITIICFITTLSFMCRGQILKDSLYMATPAEREMYRTAIKEGRRQKAVGLLVIVGGSTLTVAGAGLAIAGIVRSTSDYDYYYGDVDTNTLLWKGGATLFLVGLGTTLLGADKFKEGRRNVQTGKVSVKLNATSIDLVVNF